MTLISFVCLSPTVPKYPSFYTGDNADDRRLGLEIPATIILQIAKIFLMLFQFYSYITGHFTNWPAMVST